MANVPKSIEVLRLYKHLLKYSQNLQFTDKTYFCNRVRKEFKQNKSLDHPKDIIFNYMKGRSLLDRKSVV